MKTITGRRLALLAALALALSPALAVVANPQKGGFQTAEFLLAHGFVDAVVPRPELRASLGRLLRLLPVPVAAEAAPDDAERAWGPIGALSGFAERLGGAVSETIGIDVEAEQEGNGRGPDSAAAREAAVADEVEPRP